MSEAPIKVIGVLGAAPVPALPPDDGILVLVGAPLQGCDATVLSAPTSGMPELVMGAGLNAEALAACFPFVGSPIQGPAGPPGPPSSSGVAFISEDENNRAKEGSDGGVFVSDDLTPDPLAYYILARG